MIRPVSFLLLTAVLCGGCGNRAERSAAIPCDEPLPRPSEYVSTLVGTQSDYTLSAGNTYPAVALPWGMNFWTPQTGEMGDGWAYTYGARTRQTRRGVASELVLAPVRDGEALLLLGLPGRP